MEVYKTDSFEVDYDPQERLFLQCHAMPDSQEFRRGLLVALEFAKSHQVKQWLLDFREIGELNEQEETWIQVQLFPQIMMSLGMDNYMAVVVSEKCYDYLLKEAGLLGLKSYNSFIIINYFFDLAEASAWLDSCPVAKAG
ncbi:hypothetical protein [Pontibacter ruber]|uniref:STAS/SEC14 domain-containing protein n=1 Tax=Pontibacter ruber TaxID=1343895 RepID=A0ABW5CRP5_9BACT|nr:hypothetical protein [Pontibacter ruber]